MQNLYVSLGILNFHLKEMSNAIAVCTFHFGAGADGAYKVVDEETHISAPLEPVSPSSG